MGLGESPGEDLTVRTSLATAATSAAFQSVLSTSTSPPVPGKAKRAETRVSVEKPCKRRCKRTRPKTAGTNRLQSARRQSRRSAQTQAGRALQVTSEHNGGDRLSGWGSGGPRFKSGRPDQLWRGFLSRKDRPRTRTGARPVPFRACSRWLEPCDPGQNGGDVDAAGVSHSGAVNVGDVGVDGQDHVGPREEVWTA